MSRPMKSQLALSLILSIGFTTLACGIASATDLTARPLPREREEKDFDASNDHAPEVSRFHRRLDYREEEKLKKVQEEQARKQAIENAAKAREQAAQGAKKHEETSVSANNRGVALGQQRRWTEAISAHEQAVQHDPSNKQFRINLSAARCAYAQEKMAAGDYSAAANLCRKALSAASDNGLAGKLLVEVMKKQGRDPNNVDVRLEVGDQLAAIGDLESATVEYQAAMQLQPNAKTYLKMGDMAWRYGQISTANNWYRQAIVKDADFAPAHRQLGLLLLSQRDSTSGAAALRKAVVLDPKDGAAGQALVEVWRRQVATNPLLAENHLGYAGALQLTGDFAGAENEYRKLEALDPKYPSLEAGRVSLGRAIQHAEAEKHRAAAETLFGQNLHREALAEIGRAVSMEPRNSKYQMMFAECLEANGDYQNAHQAYLTCVLLDPERNQEAAQRMREMQRSYGSRYNFGQQATQVANQNTQQMQTAPAQQTQAPAGVQQAAPVQQTVQQAPVQAMQAPADNGLSAAMAKISELEAAKNHEEAINLLRQMVAVNLQNADLHHRLAVNLLAAAQVADSIAEFRMACALRPGQPEFAADLARAMQIHKRSQTASTPGVSK